MAAPPPPCVPFARRPARDLALCCALATSAPCQGPDAFDDCARCHVAITAEWQDSAHARAFRDPVYQQALTTRSRPDLCVPCHAPAAVLPRLGQMPLARAEQREAGIPCAACHCRDGAVHGPDGIATTAHPTVADPAFRRPGTVALCSSCHDLRIADVLPLAREFRAAGLVDEGESCVGCHMESTRRARAQDPATGADQGEPQAGRSHALLGPGDPDFCGGAFLLRLEGRGDARVLVVGNGAGHGVPGLARLRAFLFRLDWQSGAGKVLRSESFAISWPDRLLAEEERRTHLPSVDGAVALRVQVDHNFAGRKLATILDRTLELL